jgi:hypothetical protein
MCYLLEKGTYKQGSVRYCNNDIQNVTGENTLNRWGNMCTRRSTCITALYEEDSQQNHAKDGGKKKEARKKDRNVLTTRRRKRLRNMSNNDCEKYAA